MDDQELMNRAVEGFRRRRSPSQAIQDRMLLKIEAALGAPPDGGGAGGGSTGPSSGTTPMAPVTIGWIAKVAVAILCLTSVGLLAVWLAARVFGSKSQQSMRPPDPIEVSTSPLPTKPLEVPESTSPVGASLMAEPDREPTSEDRPKSASVPRQRQESADASRDTFAEEIALIDTARQASTPEVALASLDRHAREFPDGVLKDDREALRAIVQCELGRVDQARQTTLALIERRPSSPVLQRIRKRCPDLEPDLER